MDRFQNYDFGDKRSAQILVIVSFILCILTYYVVTSILPHVSHKVSTKMSTYRALEDVSRAKSDFQMSEEDLRLFREENAPVENAQPVSKTNTPKIVSLVPKVAAEVVVKASEHARPPLQERSIPASGPRYRLSDPPPDREENPIAAQPITAQRAEVTSPPVPSTKPSSKKYVVPPYVARPVPAELTNRTPVPAAGQPSPSANGGEDTTARECIIAEQDFEYFASVENDIKKRSLNADDAKAGDVTNVSEVSLHQYTSLVCFPYNQTKPLYIASVP
jgi:hypothetical protein